jgi:hypothetical protein
MAGLSPGIEKIGQFSVFSVLSVVNKGLKASIPIPIPISISIEICAICGPWVSL